MADNDVLGKLFSAAAGVWAIFLALLVAIFKAWPAVMGRQNERKRDTDSEKARDWERLRAEIDRKDARIANREKLLAERDDENDALQKENIALLARAVTAESALQGIGHARQEAAAIVAVERLSDAAKKEGNGK